MSENTSNYSVERPVQVWDDRNGERYEIGPDRDSLGLVEIRYYNNNNTIVKSISMPREVWEVFQQEKVF